MPLTARERIKKALNHEIPDRVPRFEIWIDALLEELGQSDAASAYVNFGQDCIMMPSRSLPGSNAWGDGVDEWGRVWKNGFYVDGVIHSHEDIRRFSLPLDWAGRFFSQDEIEGIKNAYPDHCMIFGTHVGPFTAAYTAMGMEAFFIRLADDPDFVHRLLEARTEWCIALFQKAAALGAEILVLGDDAAHSRAPMISPGLWRRVVLPYHERIVQALDVPVIWHSDGDIRPLLPSAVDAGFVGIHSLEPTAGIDLAQVKQEYGDSLVLIGNVDVNVLCESDLDKVRREVERCLEQGTPGGGYMISTCNSIFPGMNPAAVAELFRLEAALGRY